MAKLAFLGLGVMGAPMTRHLVEAGHELAVFNRTPKKSEEFASQFLAKVAVSPADAADKADIVFACVGNDDDVRDITTGHNGAFAGMKPGAIFVDHTTTSAALARELSGHASTLGLHFIDAPVSGGQAGAEKGALTIMCGGSEAAFQKVEPCLHAYGKTIRWMGPSGSGQMTKMVNQICIAGLIQSLAEGIQFAEKAKLDVHAVLDVISKGAGGSWQMDNRGSTMHERAFNFGFAVDLMRKDLGIVFDEAARNGARLPVTELVDAFYAELQHAGGGRLDTSSLIKRFD